MRCPECEYELRPDQADCPRCSFRRSVQAMPPSVPQPEMPLVQEHEPPLEAASVMEEPEVVPGPARTSHARTALLGIALPAVFLALALGSYFHRPAPLTPAETKIHTIFLGADGPCRQGEEASCMDSVQKIRALGDMPDGSLLLGDYRIATYVRTLPGGNQLESRWQRDEITSAELKIMGNEAYTKRLDVYKSLFMYMNIKNNHTDIPEYVIGGAKF